MINADGSKNDRSFVGPFVGKRVHGVSADCPPVAFPRSRDQSGSHLCSSDGPSSRSGRYAPEVGLLLSTLMVGHGPARWPGDPV
jgi:hypothetical protein